jgi:hypothetical protein
MLYPHYVGHTLQRWRNRAAAATVIDQSTLRPLLHRGDVAALPTVT